jgi:hypothetical protein
VEGHSAGEPSTITTAPKFAPVATSAGSLIPVAQEGTKTPLPPEPPAPAPKKAYRSVSAEKAQEWIDVIFPATARAVQGVVPAAIAGVCGVALLDPSLIPAVSHDQAVVFLTAALSCLGLGNLGVKK